MNLREANGPMTTRWSLQRVGVSGALRGMDGCVENYWTSSSREKTPLWCHKDWKYQAFRVVSSEQAHCKIALMTDSSTTSFAEIFCAWASILLPTLDSTE